VGYAGHARIHGGRPGDHPLDGEPLVHARESRVAHLLTPRPVADQLDDRLGHGRVIARRDEQSGHAVVDDFGNAAGIGRDNRTGAGHRIQKRRPEAFGHRAHHEDVEALQAAEDVGPEPWKQDVLLEPVLLDQPFQRVTQLAFAQDHEPHVRQLLNHDVGGFDQVTLTFVRHERGDVADDGRAVRKKERLVDVDERGGEDVLDVDAFVHRDRALLRHAVGDEHLADRFRCRDETVDLPVLPA